MINRDDLTASRLPIYDTDYTCLTLAIQDAPVATPNPQRDPTGVAELIQRERISLPIQKGLFQPEPQSIPAYLFMASFVVVAQMVSGNTFFTIVVVLMMVFGRGSYVYRERRRRQRIQQAWANGWLRVAPALIGDLVPKGDTAAKHIAKGQRATCTAPALVLSPKGEWIPVKEQLLRLNRNAGPHELRIAESGAAPAVDPQHNNGWVLYLAPYGEPVDQGAVAVNLSGEDEARIFSHIARTWQLPGHDADERWWEKY
ncbi:hypothetical protein MHJ95_03340 [Corynebacterium imitans]|uniref:hypothetical protein n=1 Tax=Corynebacterium imitans TaxID=156978 RepID=UPI001EF21D4E|nr:hypothetical protein [Corynebacterium imitans]MCG7278032.1 hypothetical protein [Corynebacterium imitans]